MLTYQLIEGGYAITSADGLLNIVQNCVPGVEGFVPMTPEQAKAAAEAFIAAYEAAQAAAVTA